jgi:hypothetical protein
MKKTMMFVGAVLVCLTGQSIAHAGAKSALPSDDEVNVVIAPDRSGKAWGSLGYARNTPDTTQSIGCTLAASLGSAPTIYCFAITVDKIPGTCWVSDWTLAQVVSGINSDSHLVFAWDKSGQCTSISVTADSTRAPK